MPETHNTDPSTAINEIQLVLAEKRTALALMRTGIAVLALPLSVLGLLVATSKYYNPMEALNFLLPLGLLLLLLFILGCYLIIYSIRHLHHYDAVIQKIKTDNLTLVEYID